MINIVVFSKNRACQLELLLRSARRFVAGFDDLPVAVVYTWDSEEYGDAYRRVVDANPRLRWMCERASTATFKEHVLSLVDGDRPLTVFLVDDDVFRAPFSFASPEIERLQEDASIACLSLRLCERIDYTYALDRASPPPPIEGGLFRWAEGTGDWGYPMSLDGHVFRTRELRPLLERLDFSNPNTLEARLAEAPLPGPNGLVLADSAIVNVPANRVQHEFGNRHAGADPAELNRRFLAGERIALDPVAFFPNRGVHEEIPFRWEPQPAAAGPSRPRVSVVIPCYREADYLPDAMASVLAQTFRDLELIVVDDGSPDGSGEVAERVARQHPDRSIRVIHRPNGGVAAARNTGIREARGELILPLDGDDLLEPDYLERLVTALDAAPHASIAYGDQQHFGDSDALFVQPEYDFQRLKRRNLLGSASLFRRSAWEAAGGYPEHMRAYEDWDFWISCGEHGHTGIHVPGAVYRYRVHGGGLWEDARPRDPTFKATIVLNHPRLYSAEQQAWARALLAGDTAAVGQSGPIGEIPEPAPAAPPARSHRDSLDVLAIVPSFNEADVIRHVLQALIDDGIPAYVLDNGSSDGTADIARGLLGRGVVHVERFPEDSGATPRAEREYMWQAMLERIEEIALERAPDWVVYANADEFRESPWPGLSLRAAIARVDGLGYNAINHELYDFRPVDDGFAPGTDVREHLCHYERGGRFDAPQIKTWRNPGTRVSLAPSGGHSADFPGRRIFPIPFILRHYPIRGETHGRRKVFAERLPRYTPEERAKLWHIQYDAYTDGTAEFLRAPATLVEWRPDAVRAELLARAASDLLLAQAVRGFTPERLPLDATATAGYLGRAAGFAPLAPGEVEAALRLPLAPADVPPEQMPLLVAAARVHATEARLTGRLTDARAMDDLLDTFARPRFTALAFADELVEDDELLQHYAEAFGAADNATLAIVTSDVEPLVSAVERAGLAGEDSAELVAVSQPPPSVHAIYSRRNRRLGAAPCVGDARRLRQLAEAAWA